MNNHTAMVHLLQNAGLSVTDAIRLILEMIESLEESRFNQSRSDTLRLLRRIIREGVKATERAEYTVSFEQAAIQSISARSHLRSTYRSDLRHFIRRMLRIPGVAKRPLRAMSTLECREILQSAFSSSVNSYIKGRAILSSIFNFGLKREWCDSNPVLHIDVPRVREKIIQPLTLEEVERLKRAACSPSFRDMKLSLALMLYGGVRPAEVSRLRPDDICWQEREVIIRPEVSKTGGGRMVPLRGIDGIRHDERFIPRNWKHRWRELRKAAGFRDWSSDACRHTFASYHAAHFHNLAELQWEMGHRNLSLLRSRYVFPASPEIAASFWKSAHFRG